MAERVAEHVYRWWWWMPRRNRENQRQSATMNNRTH